jgi:exonuclease VII large subunit
MAREFLAAIRKFVKDTHFTQFLKSQQQLYDVTNSRLKALMESRVDLRPGRLRLGRKRRIARRPRRARSTRAACGEDGEPAVRRRAVQTKRPG